MHICTCVAVQPMQCDVKAPQSQLQLTAWPKRSRAKVDYNFAHICVCTQSDLHIHTDVHMDALSCLQIKPADSTAMVQHFRSHTVHTYITYIDFVCRAFDAKNRQTHCRDMQTADDGE